MHLCTQKDILSAKKLFLLYACIVTDSTQKHNTVIVYNLKLSFICWNNNKINFSNYLYFLDEPNNKNTMQNFYYQVLGYAFTFFSQ